MGKGIGASSVTHDAYQGSHHSANVAPFHSPRSFNIALDQLNAWTSPTRLLTGVSRLKPVPQA
jgi:hypothetical protein